MRKELNKINASGEAQFIDILCNKYNEGKEFKGVVISGTKVSTDKGYMIVSDKMDHIQVALMKKLNESV